MQHSYHLNDKSKILSFHNTGKIPTTRHSPLSDTPGYGTNTARHVVALASLPNGTVCGVSLHQYCICYPFMPTVDLTVQKAVLDLSWTGLKHHRISQMIPKYFRRWYCGNQSPSLQNDNDCTQPQSPSLQNDNVSKTRCPWVSQSPSLQNDIVDTRGNSMDLVWIHISRYFSEKWWKEQCGKVAL